MLYQDQALGEPILQKFLQRFGHKRGGLAGADEDDPTETIQVVCPPADGQTIPLPVYLGADDRFRINGPQPGAEDFHQKVFAASFPWTECRTSLTACLQVLSPQAGFLLSSAQLRQLGGGSPLSPAKRFSAAIKAIRVRVSTVALPTWGRSTTFSRSARPGQSSGSLS